MMNVMRNAITLIASLALAGAVAAQGRHDEKPHGMSKPAEAATISEPKVHPGGRHDEQAHKSAIATEKKSAKKGSDAKASAKSSSAAPAKAASGPGAAAVPK